MDEKGIERILRCGFPRPDESARQELLDRCLSVLDQNDDGIVLDDNELDMLAAAGDLSSAIHLNQLTRE